MRKYLLWALVSLMSASLLEAAETWTNKEGKTIEAEFKGFKVDQATLRTENAHEGFKVQLEAPNGDRGTFPLTEFPQEEWKHLRKAGADYTIRLTQKHLPALALQSLASFVGLVFSIWAAARLMKTERTFGTAIQFSIYMYILTFVGGGLGFLAIADVLPLVGLRIMSVAIFVGMLVLYVGVYDFGCGGSFVLFILHMVIALVVTGFVNWLSYSFYDFTEYYDHIAAMYVISMFDTLIEQMGPGLG